MNQEVEDLLAKADEIQKTQEQVSPVPQEQQQQQYVCPVCGHPENQAMVKPDENDLREYMRCILGERLFSKIYTIGEQAQKGGMQWKLQVLTGDESSQMDDLIDLLTQQDKLAGRKKIAAIHETKLLFYVRKIGDEEFNVPDKEIKTVDEIGALFRERFGGKSELVATIGMRLLVAFEQLVAVLTQAVFDSSFWQGAGLV